MLVKHGEILRARIQTTRRSSSHVAAYDVKVKPEALKEKEEGWRFNLHAMKIMNNRVVKMPSRLIEMAAIKKWRLLRNVEEFLFKGINNPSTYKELCSVDICFYSLVILFFC